MYNVLVDTTCIGFASRTLETYLRLSTDEEPKIFYVYNHDGQYFTVYPTLQEWLNYSEEDITCNRAHLSIEEYDNLCGENCFDFNNLTFKNEKC